MSLYVNKHLYYVHVTFSDNNWVVEQCLKVSTPSGRCGRNKTFALQCVLETIIDKPGLINFLLDKKGLSMTFIRGGIVNKKNKKGYRDGARMQL